MVTDTCANGTEKNSSWKKSFKPFYQKIISDTNKTFQEKAIPGDIIETVAKQYIHNIGWTLTKDALDLPAGVTPVASCQI
jgi:hypothetical protein